MKAVNKGDGWFAAGLWPHREWTHSPGERDNSPVHTFFAVIMSYRQGRFWQPDVTVATVVVKDGKLLCVEETAGGRELVINQPAGHLEPDESLLEAAVREAREETGWDIRLTGFIGAYQWKAPESGRHYLRRDRSRLRRSLQQLGR